MSTQQRNLGHGFDPSDSLDRGPGWFEIFEQTNVIGLF